MHVHVIQTYFHTYIHIPYVQTYERQSNNMLSYGVFIKLTGFLQDFLQLKGF